MPGERRAAAALAALGALALCFCWATRRGGGRGAVAAVLEEEREPGARGRRVLNRVHGSELSHSSDESFHAWHQEHAPRESRPDFPTEGGVGTPGVKVHFSVMHVVQPTDHQVKGGDDQDKAAPQQDAGMAELMHHTDDMLRDDNAELDQENKKFAESKPKGLYESIEASKKKSAKLEKEAVDRKVDSGFKKEEADREDLRSTVEKRRGDVAAALAHEFQAKIEQRKKELAAEKMKSDEIKTQESAQHIRHQAAEDRDKAIRDARLAGRLDDKADQSSIEARRVRQEEDQSQLQLRQLNEEVKRAEEEAKRARDDAHRLRHDAAEDVRAAKLISRARKARQQARVKQSELAEARLALKAGSKAKLDILQSKLLNQAAHTHKGSAHNLEKEAEKKQEAVSRLREKEEQAETKEHEAQVQVRRLQDRLDLEKRRAKRRLERVRRAAAKAQDSYREAKHKYEDNKEMGKDD